MITPRAAVAWIAAILLIVLSLPLWAQTMMPPGTPATPGSECGAEGVGRAPDGAVVRMALPGNRVDERGNWVACDRPCIADSKPREWTVGGNACTTAPTRLGYSGPDDPRLNRALRHGTYGSWRADDQRGLLIERCNDGERVLIYASCSPPPASPETPPAPPPVASAPAPVDQGCSGTVRRSGLTAVVPRQLAEGESTTVRLGQRNVPVWCRAGRLTLEAPTLSAEQAASAGDAWRRGGRP